MKNILIISAAGLLILCGIVLIHAQDFQNPYDDNNPLIDKPTREALSHWEAFQHDGDLDVITDANGFDNFEIGIDFCETNVVSNPLAPLQIFNSVNGSGAPQNAYYTNNGGLNWILNNPAYPGGTCCDPWSAYLSTGVLLYGSGVNGQYIHRSTNNGQTWASPVLSVSGFDRNTVGAELTGTGPYANYSFASITGSGGAPFGRSTDQGATWTTTTTLSPHSVPGVMIAVGPNGTTNGGCVIVITSSGPATGVTYYIHRSTDGGASFTMVSSLTVAGYSGTYSSSAGRLHINGARHRTYPMIAMDNSNGPYRGRLYLAYSSNIPAGDLQHPDIKLQYSTDMGSTWSSYIVVNNNPNPTTSDEWFPAIWCEPTTGKLYLKWYSDQVNPSSFNTGVWASYSTTGGTTWVPNQQVSNATFTYPCPACSPACYRGDYDAITANPKVGFATWYDARNCNYQTMGGYFPDFALKVNPSSLGINGTNDSQYAYVSIPAVKLYSDTAMFSATVSPPPATGSITLTFLNKTSNVPQNILTTFPDSLRLKIKTSGGVPNMLYTIRVQGNGPNGTPVHVRNITLNVGFTGIKTINSEVPNTFYLYQNYPNPFNPTTNIRFDIAKAGNVRLIVFDVTGKQVDELINAQYGAGKYIADFNAKDLSSGIYFYRLETPDYISVKKMMLVK